VVEVLPGDVYVDPHEVRTREAWSGSAVHVAGARVDLEGPASTGTPTVVVVHAAAAAVTRVAADPDTGGSDLVQAAFAVPVHLRYAAPTAGGAPTVFSITRPPHVLVRCADAAVGACGTARGGKGVQHAATRCPSELTGKGERDGGACGPGHTVVVPAHVYTQVAAAGVELGAGWAEAVYAGLCDRANATDALRVRDLPAGHADEAEGVHAATLLVTTAGAAVVIVAALRRVRVQ
jgi:hypothetical protein